MAFILQRSYYYYCYNIIMIIIACRKMNFCTCPFKVATQRQSIALWQLSSLAIVSGCIIIEQFPFPSSMKTGYPIRTDMFLLQEAKLLLLLLVLCGSQIKFHIKAILQNVFNENVRNVRPSHILSR